MARKQVLFDVFGPKGVPPTNPTFYDDPDLVRSAASLVRSIETYWRDPEYGPWMEAALVELGLRENDRGFELQDWEDAPFQPEELPDEIGFPDSSWEFFGDVVQSIIEAQEHHTPGLPVAVAMDAYATLYAPPRERERLRLVSVSLDEAEAFIEEHHSALPYVNPRGLMYAVGLKRGAMLVAVATAGTPTGRWANPHGVLELTRIASDGTAKGASSKLAARMIDLLPLSGRDGKPGTRFVTYSLGREHGTTYLALADKGLRPVAYVRGKSAGGARKDADDTSLMGVDKVRWEAGKDAAPADWAALDGIAPAEKVASSRKAFDAWRARQTK